MPDRELAAAVKREALRLGFDFCRIVGLEEAAHADFFGLWLGQGRAGEMDYLARNFDKRRNPALLAEGGAPFRSLIVLGVDYHRFDLAQELLADPARGIIARYAWGDDYHQSIRPLLYQLDGFVRARSGRTTLGKGLVDTGPVLERDWAQRAGIGFTGKNCCTIHPQRGSWLLLATVLVPELLEADPAATRVGGREVKAHAVMAGLPAAGDYGVWHLQVNSQARRQTGVAAAHETSSSEAAKEEEAGPVQPATCGHCTRCLDACPTNAFAGPFHLDPLRCISYWTIESRGFIPRGLRRQFGNRIFGCDICQEVCPWNQRLEERSPLLPGLEAQQERVAPHLLDGFEPQMPYWLEPRAFAERWRRSPLKRAKRPGMLRNVCVALGNWADPTVYPALAAAAADETALARGHAAWALGALLRKHKDERAATRLRLLLARERDSVVLEEVGVALGLGS